MTAKVELDIEASSVTEAEEIAGDKWHEEMKHNGDYDIEGLYCYNEGVK